MNVFVSSKLSTTSNQSLMKIESTCLSGLATIKIRVSAKVNGGRLITVQTRLDGSGEEFYKLVADKLNVVSN